MNILVSYLNISPIKIMKKVNRIKCYSNNSFKNHFLDIGNFLITQLKCLFVIIILFTSLPLISQNGCKGIDTVYSVKFGSGQTFGQATQFFPKNIFGFPDTNARWETPSADQNQVCSLGLDGEIVIGFKDYEIIDGSGDDFIIFENAFRNPLTEKIFAEPAVVSVSKDGINYFQFPFDSATLAGCAGITPTTGNLDICNDAACGGDRFDLSELGLDYIKYIKIKDISSLVLNNPDHYYYDATISGFDLDALVGLNSRYAPVNVVDEQNVENGIEYNITNNSLYIENLRNHKYIIELYSVCGELMFSGVLNDYLNIRTNSFQKGIYFLILKSETGIRRIIIPLL